jgi:hypothetical protein
MVQGLILLFCDLESDLAIWEALASQRVEKLFWHFFVLFLAFRCLLRREPAPEKQVRSCFLQAKKSTKKHSSASPPYCCPSA